jgi:anti-anti-sigma regulatory factor
VNNIGEAMLKIGVNEENGSTKITVEGKLTGPFGAELEKSWAKALAANPSKPIVVNLASVTFVDSVSRELLVRMRRQGVNLVPTGCLMNAIVEQIEAELASEASEY